MLINRIEGATRILARDQSEYLQLPIRDIELIAEGDGSARFPAMLSSWQPTPDELARLMCGASIILQIMGSVHPPVHLSVSEAPT